MKKWIRFLKDKEGFTTKEYGLITMIAMGIIATVVVFLQFFPYLQKIGSPFVSTIVELYTNMLYNLSL